MKLEATGNEYLFSGAARMIRDGQQTSDELSYKGLPLSESLDMHSLERD